MSENPAYVPFFEETLRSLAYLDGEDVKRYVLAIIDYVYEGREPDMDGPAMSVFTMGRYQLDQKLGQRAKNRENARRRRGGGPSATEATDERTGSEPGANPELTASETEANGERTASESGANDDKAGRANDDKLQAPNYKLQAPSSPPPLPLPPLEPVRVKTGDAPPFGEVPTEGQWAAYCERLCRDRGVEPDPDDFARSFGNYQDHGWCHGDGTRYGNWHLLASTCVRKLGEWQSERPSRTRGRRPSRASPDYRPSEAALRADREAEVVTSL